MGIRKFFLSAMRAGRGQELKMMLPNYEVELSVIKNDPYPTVYESLLSTMFVSMSPRLVDLLQKEISFKVNNEIYKGRINIDGYYYQNSIIVPLLISEMGNYYDFVPKSGRCSFHPKPDKQEFTDDLKWKKEGRQEFKPVKLIKKFINLHSLYINGKLYHHRDDAVVKMFIEKLTHYLKVMGNPMDIAQVSDNVPEVYALKHAPNRGTLSSSCMRNMDSDIFKSFYEALEEQGVKPNIVYVEIDGMLMSRALLWNNVQLNKDDGTSEEITLLDRIYGTESDIEAYKEWAKSKGYAYKVCQSYCDHLIMYNGQEYLDYHIEVSDWEEFTPSHAPYMDTFYLLNEDNVLSHETALSDYEKKFRNTDGTYTGMAQVCDHCNYEYTDGEEYNGQDLCRSCYDQAYTCDDCSCTIFTQDEDYISLRNGNYYCSNCYTAH